MTLTGHTPGVRVPTQIATAVLPVQSAGSAPDLRYFQARPKLRRVVYVVGYEGLSVLFTVVVLSALLGHGGGESTLAAILVSTTATLWNYVWNTLYEAFERRRRVTGRGARGARPGDSRDRLRGWRAHLYYSPRCDPARGEPA